jgi:putative endopeptidase
MVNIKPESLANQLLTDVHAPAKYRINGVVENMPEFHKAFNIKPGSKMRRKDSELVSIW